MQRSVGAVGYGDQVVGAERLAASIAMELVAAGTEHLAAGGVRAKADFEECATAIFVILNRKALEKCVASGAGDRVESTFHIFIIMLVITLCQA